jgi:hypothetical protein
MLIKISNYDLIFLSYDEPNADQNYEDLCKKIPWAKRVHGVKGSDSAHKACAQLSETERFIIIDGDNIVDENFIQQEFEFTDNDDLSNSVISWAASNQINELVYGNGGIKSWTKNTIFNMRTHENADPNNIHAQVDFCWNIKYIQMEGCYSKIYNNATPQQAWRAGFREGVKMALDNGIKPSIDAFKNNHWKNLHRLYVWLMIGSDVKNGLWAIYGAREGLFKTMCTDWNFVNVRDFDYLNNLWNTTYSMINETELPIEAVGKNLMNKLDIPIAEMPLNPQQSNFFKTIYRSPSRTN